MSSTGVIPHADDGLDLIEDVNVGDLRAHVLGVEEGARVCSGHDCVDLAAG